MNVAIAIKDDGSIRSGYANYVAQEVKAILLEDGNGACVYKVKSKYDRIEYCDREIPKTEKAWGIEFDTVLLVDVIDSSEEKVMEVISAAPIDKLKLADSDFLTTYSINTEFDFDTFHVKFFQNVFNGISFTSSDIENVVPELVKKVLAIEA